MQVLVETNASLADDPYTPASYSSINSSSSSSSIISSYALDWKMDLSFDPFAKCELPRMTEDQNEVSMWQYFLSKEFCTILNQLLNQTWLFSKIGFNKL